MSALPASQVLLDQVEAAVRGGACTLAAVVEATGRSPGLCSGALRVLVEVGEIAAAGRTNARRWAPTQAEADALTRKTPKQSRSIDVAERDTVAAEFLETRRARWARELRDHGFRTDLAKARVAGVVSAAEWRVLRARLCASPGRAA